METIDKPVAFGMPLESGQILGVRVDDVTYEEALELAERYIESGQSHQIVTLNPEFVIAAQKDEQFKNILNSASLSLPDGIGLLWAARILGFQVREHVRGTDFVERIAAISAEKGYRVFFLGAAEGVAEEAARNLQQRHPGLQISGCFAGLSGESGDTEARQAIKACGKTDIILVAYGAPAQDKWVARNLSTLGIPIGVGVGGVFDFFSGRVKRAPVWMRKFELEWLYRLIMQPWRWKRQLSLPTFVLAVLWVRLRGGRTIHG